LGEHRLEIILYFLKALFDTLDVMAFAEVVNFKINLELVVAAQLLYLVEDVLDIIKFFVFLRLRLDFPEVDESIVLRGWLLRHEILAEKVERGYSLLDLVLLVVI
jgi:hypothetical protein